jgi:hypothetical protein
MFHLGLSVKEWEDIGGIASGHPTAKIICPAGSLLRLQKACSEADCALSRVIPVSALFARSDDPLPSERAFITQDHLTPAP